MRTAWILTVASMVFAVVFGIVNWNRRRRTLLNLAVLAVISLVLRRPDTFIICWL